MDYVGGSENTGNNENDEFDNEYDGEEDDYVQNEEPLEELNDDFKNKIQEVKINLYNNTVMLPALGTPEAQDDKLRKEYLKHVNNLYILMLRAQNGKNTFNDKMITRFPEGSREVIIDVLKWIENYFNKNNIPDTIPYSDHITQQFHVYPYIRN